MNKGLAVLGIWIGVGLIAIGAGIAGVKDFGFIMVVAMFAMLATIFA